MATPLTKDRRTDHKALGRSQTLDVAASTIIYKGAMVCVDAAGNAIPAANAAANTFAGVADHQADNSGGAAGDVTVKVWRSGVFSFNAESGDEPTAADLMRPVYAASDNEVEATAGAGTVAGTLEEIDGSEYWVNLRDQA